MDSRFLKPIIFFILVSNIFIWSLVFSFSKDETLNVYFLDVGQGDSILIVAPNGKTILVDGGANSSVLRGLGKALSFWDRKIDVVVATHPDQDHIGGLPFVFEKYKVLNFIDSVVDSDTNSYKALMDLAKDQQVRTLYGLRGMVINLDKENGVYLQILYPEPDDFEISDTNDMSIVAKLVYGDTSVMLTGDAPKIVETKLLSTDKESLKSSVLKVGHHGSKTSTSRAFVSVTKPAFAIISAGQNNRYGHPNKETMDILNSKDLSILETSSRGTIHLTSNGVDFWVNN
jgi:competence protein ComEC